MATQQARLRASLLALAAGLVAVRASAAEPARGQAGARPVRSGCEYDYAPFSIVRPDGQADGFSVQLMRAALKAMGRDVAFKTAPWPELKQDLAEGRLDALPLVARSPEREAIYDFTFPYLTMHGTIVVRDGDDRVRGPEDLRGKEVAVLKEDIAHEYLRRADLGATIVPLPSFAVALRELSEGKHDAVVVQKLLAFQLMNELGLRNLKTVGPPLTGYTQVFSFAVPKGRRELLGVLNEGLSIVMADGTFRHLHAEWFSSLEAIGRARSRIVVGGDADYPPYEFLDQNGQPAGYNVDLTRAIARQLGVAVDIQLGPWARTRARLEQGGLDLVQGMFYSAQRDEVLSFSPPHAIVQHAIVARRGSAELRDMSSLADKSILLMAGDILHDLALGQGYGKHVLAVATQEEALRRLAAGEGDCALVARVPALYWIERNRWRNLVVSGEPVLAAEYGYAVRKGNDALLSAFAEGLAAVKKTGEYRAIQTRWLGPYQEVPIGFWTIAGYALLGAIPLAGLLLGSVLWSRSLRRQVQRRTEELRAANARLVEADQRKSEFLAMLSHELRNPLAPIRNSVYLLDHAPAGGEQGARARDVIRRQTRHLTRLVDDLLDVTRISQGKIELRRFRIDARGVVSRSCDDHRSVFDQHGVALSVAVPGAPVWIEADATRIAQVVGNLLQNAAKYTPEGGSATVSVAATAGLAEIRVADDGVGIAPDLLPHVFEPFVQHQAGLERAQGGLGLGLALVKGFAELHGGSVRAASGGPSRGSEFVVTLPLAPAGDRTGAAPVPAAASAAPRLVLVVEDYLDSAQALADVLALHGHDVHIATNGRAGAARARELKPDVVLCDIGLPDMNGYEIARALRSDRELRSTFLIALSGYAQAEDTRRAAEAGFDAHLAKPADVEELAALVARAPLRTR
ncbi:MAG TPA: transporter substrate-binding domain-containing protein [Anaeromyxobacteraceae bacterium]|nr:transporter substrate-binding domain-containing protein [Anaeromyxobacteraceae bacterium]